MLKSSFSHLLAGVVIFAIILVAGYFYFVQIQSGQAFDNVAYFGHKAVDRAALHYDGDLLGEVSVRALLIVAGVLFVLSLFRRRFLIGLVIIGGLAGAVVGAELFKHHLPRPELAAPDGAVPAYFSQDTYPSGHTTIGTSVVLAFLMLAPVRWRPWLAGPAGLFSASYATAVLFEGWHRPSDAVGGILWSGVCLGLAAAFVIACQRSVTPPAPISRGALSLSAGICALSLMLAWFSTGWLGPQFPAADFPFLFMTGLIVLTAFAVTAWFGWVLSAEGSL